MSNKPLIVIVGPTASGKTGLAVKLAKEFDAEIISADSRAVYRGLDLGTAKPTIKERSEVPHWGIDLVDPGERFTAADFKEYALAKIADIRSRGRVPILVGGTGLYINGVIYDYTFHKIDYDQREELNQLSLETLTEYCINNNIKLPINSKNKRHIISAVLRKGLLPQRKYNLPTNSYVVGISTNRQDLIHKITTRANYIFDNGIVEEAIIASEKFGWNNEALKGNVYPLIHEVLNNSLSLEQAKSRFIALDARLAKRQMTWFKRDSNIKWLTQEDAYTYIAHILATL